MKVLIVDDDHMSCQCLQQLIDWASIGCEQPLCAFNGAEALKLIEAGHPDIVVSDVKMPVMDGRELCRQIYEKYPDINLFFVSAYGDFETAQLAIRYQVKGYVLKPLDADALRTLRDMICETAVRQESTSFFIKICGDEYRDVLKCAIEEKDREMVERFLDRVERLQDNLSLEDMGLWQHLIAPLIDYRKTCLKMDYGLLLQTERKLQDHGLPCAGADGLAAGTVRPGHAAGEAQQQPGHRGDAEGHPGAVLLSGFGHQHAGPGAVHVPCISGQAFPGADRHEGHGLHPGEKAALRL